MDVAHSKIQSWLQNRSLTLTPKRWRVFLQKKIRAKRRNSTFTILPCRAVDYHKRDTCRPTIISLTHPVYVVCNSVVYKACLKLEEADQRCRAQGSHKLCYTTVPN